MTTFIVSFFHRISITDYINEEDKIIRKKYILNDTNTVIRGCHGNIIEDDLLVVTPCGWVMPGVEDGTFLQNMGKQIPNHTAQQSRWPASSQYEKKSLHTIKPFSAHFQWEKRQPWQCTCRVSEWSSLSSCAKQATRRLAVIIVALFKFKWTPGSATTLPTLSLTHTHTHTHTHFRLRDQQRILRCRCLSAYESNRILHEVVTSGRQLYKFPL